MLNIHLLKEGRPSRPKTSIVVLGLVSLGIIVFALGFYIFVNFIPAISEAANSIRVDMVVFGNELHFDGVQSFTVFLCIPLGCLGALVGAINLKRMTDAKPFLGALHIIPIFGLIVTILGAVFYFFLHQVIAMLPEEITFDPSYIAYFYGAVILCSGILIADIIAIFYRYINSSDYAPIYRNYKEQLKKAENAVKRNQIKKDFIYFWKKRKYDDLICLLFGDNIDVECEAMLTPDAFAYLKDKAIQAYIQPKKKQLDKMYKDGENAALRRELAILCRTAEEADAKKAAAGIDAKKQAGAAAPIKPNAAPNTTAPANPAPAKQLTPKDQKEIDAEKQRLEKERKENEERLKKERAEKEKAEASAREKEDKAAAKEAPKEEPTKEAPKPAEKAPEKDPAPKA